MHQQFLEDDQTGYQFSAQPKPIKGKQKYREENEVKQIMNNLYKKQTKNKPQKPSQRAYKQEQYQQEDEQQSDNIIQYEQPSVEQPSQTLHEELTDPVDEDYPIDFYIDRPPTPEYKPLPKGREIATQIDDLELYDFQLEVEPILETIVGKTLDQARIELIEEEEQKQFKQELKKFEKKRNAELMVTQRVEAHYLRRKHEREHRSLQHKIRDQSLLITTQKFLSKLFSKTSLANIKVDAINNLEAQGVLRDDLAIQIRQYYIPWLCQSIQNEFIDQNREDEELKEAIYQVQDQLERKHQQIVDTYLQKKQKIAEEKRLTFEAKQERRRLRGIERKKYLTSQSRILTEKQIKDSLIKSFKPIQDIFNENITEINGDSLSENLVAILGGLFGELWNFFQSLDKILQQAGLAPLTQEQMLRFLTELLSKKLTKPLKLTLNTKYKDEILKNCQLMEDNLDEFHLIKQELISTLSEKEDLLLTNNEILQQIYLSKCYSMETVKLLQYCLLEFMFKSIKYKELPKEEVKPPSQQPAEPKPLEDTEKKEEVEENQQKQEEEKTQEQQQEQQEEKKEEEKKDNEEQQLVGEEKKEQADLPQEDQPQQQIEQQQEQPAKKVYPPRPEITDFDHQMLQAKSKLHLTYQDSLEDWRIEPYTELLRFRIPLSRELTREEIRKRKEEEEQRLLEEQEAEREREREREEAKVQKKKGVGASVVNQEEGKGNKIAKLDESKQSSSKNLEMSRIEKKSSKSEIPKVNDKKSSESKKRERSRQQKTRKQQEENKFIEPFDGSTFAQQKFKYPEVQTDQITPYSMNPKVVKDKKLAIIDEKSQYILRNALFNLFLSLFSTEEEPLNIHFQPLYDAAQDSFQQFENQFLERLRDKYEELPIFDYEL